MTQKLVKNISKPIFCHPQAEHRNANKVKKISIIKLKNIKWN